MYLDLRTYLVTEGGDRAASQRDAQAMAQLQNQDQSYWVIAKRIVTNKLAFIYNQFKKIDATLFMDASSAKFFNDTILKAKVYG